MKRNETKLPCESKIRHIYWLVGDLEHVLFFHSVGNNNPMWLIFFRRVPPSRLYNPWCWWCSNSFAPFWSEKWDELLLTLATNPRDSPVKRTQLAGSNPAKSSCRSYIYKATLLELEINLANYGALHMYTYIYIYNRYTGTYIAGYLPGYIYIYIYIYRYMYIYIIYVSGTYRYPTLFPPLQEHSLQWGKAKSEKKTRKTNCS